MQMITTNEVIREIEAGRKPDVVVRLEADRYRGVAAACRGSRGSANSGCGGAGTSQIAGQFHGVAHSPDDEPSMGTG